MRLFQNISNLYDHRNLIIILVQRELKARYRGSLLGFFWSFLNPFILMIIYSLVFSVFLRQDSLEVQPYAVFLFSGLLPWMWFLSSTLEATGSLFEGGNLVKKVIFPTEILPIVKIFSNLVNFLFSLIMLLPFNLYYFVLNTPINPLYNPVSVNLLFLPLIILIHFLFMAGVALMLSSLNVHFRDIQQLIGNFLTFWFFLTPIIYPKEVLLRNPSPLFQFQYKLNPLAHINTAYQDIFFYGKAPDLNALLRISILSLLVFYIGYWIFDRIRDSFSEVV